MASGGFTASGYLWQTHPPEKQLVERFHITTGFHLGQRTIIEQLVQGKRVLAIQRTGWGKSLCYQMASLYYPHLTIIFSPLKALMRDQCQRCNDVYGISSAIVSSDFSEEENQETLERALAQELKLLFIAPERLSNPLWQHYTRRLRISMIVIDEAHCISTWGHDFRPHYRRIVHLLEAIPRHTPVLALTATANKRVEADILQQMGAGVRVTRGTMQRPNLHAHVVRVRGDAEKLAYLASALPNYPGTGIIYTATRHDAEMVAAFLARQGITTEYYHGEREDEVRQEIERNLLANRYKVVCSTNALGMGIDKPDIRFIVHYHIPASPVHYYQEMGRAGRDGQIARCILLYDPKDLIIQEHFINNAKPESRLYERVLSALRSSGHESGERDLMRTTGLAQTPIRTILSDLEDQHFIERNPRNRMYSALRTAKKVDFSGYDSVRKQKLHELDDMQGYAHHPECYMEYVTTQLGDQPGYQCGTCSHCRPEHFPPIVPDKRIQHEVALFLDEEALPRIEQYSSAKEVILEAGWALAYYGSGDIGNSVRASKYEGGGAFGTPLVARAMHIICTRYPLGTINGIVSVPPTKSGGLVEDFARRVAASLNIEYLSVLQKIRRTKEQKDCTNWVQKKENVKDAFIVQSPESIAGRVLLLIDDIYDSGYMLREIGGLLMRLGAQAVYPLTITRTRHSDNQ